MHRSRFVGRRRLGALGILAVTSLAVGLAPPAANAVDAPAPTPKATCGPGSRPEPAIQGRAPADDPARAQGYSCNLELVSQFGDRGGYKVHRYVDKAGRE